MPGSLVPGSLVPGSLVPGSLARCSPSSRFSLSPGLCRFRAHDGLHTYTIRDVGGGTQRSDGQSRR